jgi:hypothetical protein
MVRFWQGCCIATELPRIQSLEIKAVCGSNKANLGLWRKPRLHGPSRTRPQARKNIHRVGGQTLTRWPKGVGAGALCCVRIFSARRWSCGTVRNEDSP